MSSFWERILMCGVGAAPAFIKKTQQIKHEEQKKKITPELINNIAIKVFGLIPETIPATPGA